MSCYIRLIIFICNIYCKIEIISIPKNNFRICNLYTYLWNSTNIVMDIKNIIIKINSKTVDNQFDLSKVASLSKFLSTLGHLNYVGHGCLCLCFSHVDRRSGAIEVVKCCRKGSRTILHTKDLFLSKINLLKDYKMPILYPYEILYDDDYWLVYTQPYCQQVESADISYKMCYEILDFVEQMIVLNVRLSDIYYRNFGLYKNHLCLFDYHEIDTFDFSSNFLTNNLYSLFILLGKNVGWHQNLQIPSRITFSDDHEKYNLPNVIVELLKSFSTRDHTGTHSHVSSLILESIKNARAYLKKQIPCKYDNYQLFTINDEGVIDLTSHTLSKYQIVENLIKDKNVKTILDARCYVGGIGLKLAQEFPELQIHLNNETVDELEKAQKNAKSCMLFNVAFTAVPVQMIRPHRLQKYDVTMYYSTFHHLLKTMTIDEIILIVRSQTQKYCIIETPIMGDSLLDKIMKQPGRVENFRCLASPETFRYHLIMNQLKVNKCIKLNYENNNLIRYAYICSPASFEIRK
jgi:hypothetical protein